MEKSTINVVSLFSGCGGFDIGLANADQNTINTNLDDSSFNFVWSNDLMDKASKTYSKNFDKDLTSSIVEDIENNRQTIYCGDIREVDFYDHVPIEKNEVNMVVGGFPCQDFSILRGEEEREGIDVDRGKLYLEFARGLATLQPDLFIAENVKGLVSANDGRAYSKILDDFSNLDRNWSDIEEEYESKKEYGTRVEDSEQINGYSILHSEVVDFSNLGVPQGRERLIIVGLRKDHVDTVEEHLNKDVKQVCSDLNQHLSSYRKFEEYPLTTMEIFTGQTLGSLEQKYSEVMNEFSQYIDNLDCKTAEEFRTEVWPKYSFRIWDDYFWINDCNNTKNTSEISKNHKKCLAELGYESKPLSSQSYKDDSNEEMREQDHVLERLRHIPPDENYKIVRDTEHEVAGMMSNMYKRVHPLKPSPTIVASGGGGTWGYHYQNERGKLTNRERARIQTFPDDYIFDGSNSEVRKQIGNAVPPLGAKKIGESVLPILKVIVDK